MYISGRRYGEHPQSRDSGHPVPGTTSVIPARGCMYLEHPQSLWLRTSCTQDNLSHPCPRMYVLRTSAVVWLRRHTWRRTSCDKTSCGGRVVEHPMSRTSCGIRDAGHPAAGNPAVVVSWEHPVRRTFCGIRDAGQPVPGQPQSAPP